MDADEEEVLEALVGDGRPHEDHAPALVAFVEQSQRPAARLQHPLVVEVRENFPLADLDRLAEPSLRDQGLERRRPSTSTVSSPSSRTRSTFAV